MKKISIFEKIIFIIIAIAVILEFASLFPGNNSIRNKMWQIKCGIREALFSDLTPNYCKTIPEVLKKN